MNWAVSRRRSSTVYERDVLVHCLAGRQTRLQFMQFYTFSQMNKFCISQGSAVTFFRCGGQVHTLNSRLLVVTCCHTADLRLSDTALYTCKAVSETGETSWTAALVVQAPSPSIVFHRTPEPSTFPGAPSKPTVSEITATSVRLTWRPNTKTGASQTHSYTVEYFSHDTGEVSDVLTHRPTQPPTLGGTENKYQP